MKTKGFPTWVDLLAVVGMFVVAGSLAALIVPGGEAGGIGVFWKYLLMLGATIAFALALTRQRTGSFRGVLRFSLKGFDPVVILWGLILMLAVSVVIEPLIELFPERWYTPVAAYAAAGGWAMVTAVVAAPILEETLFRGILQDALVRKRGAWPGVLIASGVFGIIHIVPQQVVAAFLIGVILGFVYQKTRSLAAVIVLHAIHNGLALVTNFFDSGEEGLATQTLRQAMGGGKGYWVVYAVCAALLVVALAQAVRKKSLDS